MAPANPLLEQYNAMRNELREHGVVVLQCPFELEADSTELQDLLQKIKLGLQLQLVVSIEQRLRVLLHVQVAGP